MRVLLETTGLFWLSETALNNQGSASRSELEHSGAITVRQRARRMNLQLTARVFRLSRYQ